MIEADVIVQVELANLEVYDPPSLKFRRASAVAAMKTERTRE